jgi:hypothetical protein
MSTAMEVIQVLLLFEEKSSEDFGLALWAALHEVEAFYNLNEIRMNARRLYIAPSIPSRGLFRKVGSLFGYQKYALELPRPDEYMVPIQTLTAAIEPDAESPSSKPQVRRPYDQEKLAGIIREQILRERFGAVASTSPLMVITDQLITPPEEWLYIIWWSSTPSHSAVISTAPLDPTYWDYLDPNRVATIKNRTRAAAMSVCGSFLDLQRCRNPRCFLFEPVESVTNLDYMYTLGTEHSSEALGLTGKGFAPIVNDPFVVQQIITASRGRIGGTK